MFFLHHIGNAMSQNACFASSGTSEDEHRALDGGRGFSLLRVQLVKY